MKPVFKNKAEAEAAYAREYLRIVEQLAHGNMSYGGAHPEKKTLLDMFFVEHVEEIVEVPSVGDNSNKTNYEFRGQHGAVIALFEEYWVGYNAPRIARIWGNNPPPIIKM